MISSFRGAAAALLAALALVPTRASAADTQITVWNRTTGTTVSGEIGGVSVGQLAPGSLYRSTMPTVGSNVQGTVMYDVRIAKPGTTSTCSAQIFVNITLGLTVGCSAGAPVNEGTNCTAQAWYYMASNGCAAQLTILD